MMHGWLSIKKASNFGNKRRFCKLLGEVAAPDAPPPPNTPGGHQAAKRAAAAYMGVTLYILHKEGDPVNIHHMYLLNWK